MKSPLILTGLGLCALLSATACGRVADVGRTPAGSQRAVDRRVLDAVAGEHWNRSAARLTAQPSSTISEARRRRPSGVKGALA